jgi:ABC-type dipeptide/oligopeptide/nickel transport system permease component
MRWAAALIRELFVPLLLAVTLVFFLLRVLPGDGMTTQLIESGASAELIADRRAALGLDQPIIVQYGAYLVGLMRGQAGVSLIDGLPVSTLLAEAIPHTLSLGLAALIIAVAVGGGLGILAVKGSSVVRKGARLIIGVGLSAPTAFTATAAIALISVSLGWLPASGSGTLDRLILPAWVLGLASGAVLAEMIAQAVIETERQLFVQAAHGRGLKQPRVLWHVLRAAAPVIITGIALQGGFLLGGTAVTEVIFARPGVGRLLVDAALRGDYPVVQGAALWMTLAAIITSLAGEAGVMMADPRVRDEA